MPTKTASFRSNRGFTLVEIVIVSILLGIFATLTAGYIRDAATTGRANTLNKNAQEINNCINDLRAAGATFATGTYATTAGASNTPASLTFPATAVAANVTTFLGTLTTGGLMSLNHTTILAKTVTTTSYTYTMVNNIPVFTGIAGSAP